MNSLVFISYFFACIASRNDTLVIDVTNVQVGKGSVFVSIFKNEETFFKKPFADRSVKADSSIERFSFELPDGEYAISIYQDVNDNKKLDLGIFNIPKEPVGFGNNFRPKFSAPKYKDCAMIIDKSKEIQIEIR